MLVKLSQTWSNVSKLVLFGMGRYSCINNKVSESPEKIMHMVKMFLNKLRRIRCHAPNPGPTRMVDPNRFPGRETQDWDSLPDFFFFFEKPTGTCGYGPHL